jgi:hypothetical protein
MEINYPIRKRQKFLKNITPSDPTPTRVKINTLLTLRNIKSTGIEFRIAPVSNIHFCHETATNETWKGGI